MKNIILLAAIGLTTGANATSVITFDETSLNLAPESFYLPGPALNLPVAGFPAGPESMASFDIYSGGATFNHEYTEFGGDCCFSHFTYSNTSDTTTSGFGNQFSAITGEDVGGGSDENYGIANRFGGPMQVIFDTAAQIEHAYFTNTTYAFLAMQNGDPNPSFGFDAFDNDVDPTTGEIIDFHKVTVSGLDQQGNTTGSVIVDLAIGANLVDTWLFTDLSSLDVVYGLQFEINSSNFGVPAYFAFDNISYQAVPIPAAAWLFLSALTGLRILKSRKQVK